MHCREFCNSGSFFDDLLICTYNDFINLIGHNAIFCEFYRNFNQLWIFCKKLDTRNQNPN